MTLGLEIPDTLRRNQARASDPGASAFVSANAGSGKTHVLTQRVLRLLLDGAKPAQILGLTFTKAAAANMASRIFKTLADWTSLDDDKLTEAIVATGAGRPGPPGLAFARRLFARTIETPGGLKIQTLHAFCERLLQLFPFEANVPAHFKVVDDRDARALMTEARNRAIAALEASPEGKAALDRVAREAGVFGFDALLKEAVGFAENFEAFPDAARYGEALRIRLGLDEGETTASLEAAILEGDIGLRRRKNWAQRLEGGSANDQKRAAALRAVESDASPADALLRAFFTGGGLEGPVASLVTQTLAKCDPSLLEDMGCEQVRLTVLRDRRRAAQTIERSVGLFTVAGAILQAFAAAKAARGALDFADQISRALALVTRSSAAWVMHKLDYGLDHLLIDEAQDNSAEQWRIVEKLTDEFFAGEGARPGRRTVFAVGDEKQSIFSFQGAAPERFAEMRRHFERRHRDAEKPFEAVPLNASFRSAPAILAAVDLVFQSEAVWPGVVADGEPPPAHEAIRKTLKGVVEIWPTVAPDPASDPDDWRMPLDEPTLRDPSVILAARIADAIADWVAPDSRDRVVDAKTGAPRRIREGDVMILVRRRNAFFEAMIRALKHRGVKVAGADRLRLNEHIAVMDLIAAGRAALTRDDDLTLACLLKSPLVGLDDEALYALAADRPASLASALAAADEGWAKAAERRLALWRGRAASLGPYAFYARLLGEDGGRKALVARLGDDARDPIDEFLALALAHEQCEAPSLTRFLAEVEADESEIKRDLEAESEGVRVLTVHASKGLEAPIVFLPDTTISPGGQHDPKLMRLAPARPGAPPLFAWSRKKAEDCTVVAGARHERREAEAGEHRRLLYVAMTRAAERLIFAGYEGQRRRPDDCWYDLVSNALKGVATETAARDGAAVRRYGEALVADGGGEDAGTPPPEDLPGWLGRRAAPEAGPVRVRPSGATASIGDAWRIVEGRLAHALLQILPGVEPGRRAETARVYLEAHGAALPETVRRSLSTQTVAVVEAPALATLFGPGSRGEVAFAGALKRPGRPDLPLAGRLDRLAVTDEAVLIVDFKLGAAPTSPSETHVAQLALYRAALQPLYPGLPMRAALVYLDGATIRPLSQTALEIAVDTLLTL